MAIRVKIVDEGSFAESLAVVAGDYIVKINGKHVYDFLDMDYFTAVEELSLELLKDGKLVIVEGSKDVEEPFGVTPEDHKCRECANNCIFCFIDQMPPGMRDTLYVKDDDYSYSFIFGNYVTLTNLSEATIEKIIEMKISPLYISVHTTNSKLRRDMMRYKADFEILEVLERLAKGGIEYHTQLVLVPGFNDGEELVSSLNDLTSPKLNTIGIGVVPVGTTKHRKNLSDLPLFNKEKAEDVVRIVDQFKESFPAVYASDEIYIKAEIEIPQAEYYGPLDEIENGIGMVRTFLNNWDYEKTEFASFVTSKVKKDLLFVTGVSAQHYIKKVADELNSLISPYKANVKVINNKFMGESVTVCGLLTFGDVKEQISLSPNQIPLFSGDFFNSEGITLDNYDYASIKNELNSKIVVINPLFESWEII
ncbi:MAG: hypothetical protein B6226_05340 [Candidatus Cloacimonetes bacterium 4572_65]|nr:MAG: hypothetical protein B6226_05340 [Candidatus Cloacimonetes bacterium 4572_65]